jgi:aryl-alcohol dehydrogenase-like predicted oxidoreductase
MDYVNLGRSGVKVSKIALGCMSFGREADEEESMRMVNRALDYGINFFDTANSYSNGRSEEILGEALKGKRNRVVIGTKVSNPMGEGPNDRGCSRYHILRSVEESLRRLHTDRIDLYQIHRFDPGTPLDESLRALDDLVRWGKVIYIGCSNFTFQQLANGLGISKASGLTSFISLQPMYNILKPEPESDLLPLCLREGIGVIPYNPLAGGFLTGKYQSDRVPSAGTRLGDQTIYQERYLSEENFRRTSLFLEIAKRRGLNPIGLAVAWAASHPAVTCPIIGARNEKQLRETLELASVKLSIEEREQIKKEVWGQANEDEAP